MSHDSDIERIAASLTSIGKASSALRFRANNFDMTEPAKKELLAIASDLTDLESILVKCTQSSAPEREVEALENNMFTIDSARELLTYKDKLSL